MGRILPILVVMVLLVMCVIPSTGSVKRETYKQISSRNTFYVGGSGPNNYTEIQEAIDNSSDGDTIFIYSGIYNESIFIDNTLILLGEDKNTTIIDGTDISYNTIFVTANADNMLISHLTIKNNQSDINGTGIYLVSDSNLITQNVFMCWLGIRIEKYEGDVSCENEISHNYFDDSTGAWIFHSNHNLIHNNSYNRFVHMVRLVNSSNDVIRNNYGENGFLGVWSTSSKDSIIIENVFIDSSGGISLQYSSNFEIAYNIIRNVGNGITFHREEGGHNIHHNIIEDCNTYAIYVDVTNDTKIHDNHIENNEYIMNLMGGMGNLIYNNNFLDNIRGAFFLDIRFHFYFINKNRWFNNFWDGFRVLPKPIFGFLIGGIYDSPWMLPWFQFDMIPAKTPHDIVLPDSMEEYL